MDNPTLVFKLDAIKKDIRMVANKKKGKSLSELVDDIITKLHEAEIALNYTMEDPEMTKWGDCFVFSSRLSYFFISRNVGEYSLSISGDTGAVISACWFVTGSGETPEIALSSALLGAKERFLLYYFDVPKKDLDPATIIKQERFELESQRTKEMQSILDKMHAMVRERILHDPDFQKVVDETTKGFVRVNGKPSTNYYEIKTLETAQALSRAVDKLLNA